VFAAREILGAAPSSNVMDAHKSHSTQPRMGRKSPIKA
jgi:hypothetical protein